MGRPTGYHVKYCKEIIDYFSIAPYEEKAIQKAGKDGPYTIKENVAADVPTLAGFASSIGIHRATLIRWTEKYPEFCNAYKRAKDYQEHFLVTNVNKGLIVASAGIFTLKNVSQWRDKVETENKNTNYNFEFNEVTKEK